MTIEFPDKLRSTRRDRKLVDAEAIDGMIQLAQLAENARNGAGHVWRPFFFVLENVGPAGIAFSTVRRGHVYDYDQTNQVWNRTANLVSQADYDQSGDRLLVGTNRVRANGSTQQDLSVLPEGQTPSSFEYPWSASPPVSLSGSEKLFAIWAYLGDPSTGDQNAVAIRGPVEMAGGYHAEAAHAINLLTPLIEQEFDGTTGTDTGEVQVAGVSIENSQAVAYAIRVGAATEYALGAKLHALRSNAPLEIGIANFYSKAGDDAGKLYHTLDEATDGALKIWKVNDLAAIRAILAALGGGGETFTAALKAKLEGLNDAVIDLLEPLEGDGLSVGDVVLSDRKFHRYATPGIANAFAGVLGTYRENQTYYLVTSRSDSHFGAHGRFNDNHDAAIGAVLVGQGTNNVMEVQIDKAAYETAKGSAVASDDEISAAFTGTVAGSETTTTHVLPYVRSFTVGGKTWLSFEGQAPNSVPKRVGTHPDGWSLIVSQGGSVLLTHAVDDSHFTEYPIEAIDQAARDIIDAETTPGAIRDALQTLTGDARLDASAVKDLPQPVAGLAGLRTESISFQEDVAESPGDELSPLAQDPVAVVHGDGDPEMLTGLSGNDFTVAPGLYFIQATGNHDGAGIGHFALQFRQSSDNAVIAAMPNVFFYNTGEQPFTASAYWHVTEAVEVNLFLARFDSRAVGVADLVVSFARLTAEDTADRHVIEPLEPLDTDEANDGEVVLSEHEFYVRQPGHGTANTFAGELERWTDGADTWLGTAIRNSVYGQRGQFSSNPDSNVGVLLAGVSADNANTIDVWIRKAAYDAALGRSAQSGDTVKLVITGEVSGTATTVTSALTYAVFHGDSGYYSFSAVDAANVLRQLADGAAWSMVVNRANDAPLLTHAAGAAHFVEYPIRSAIDQFARDAAQKALSEITLSFEQSRYPRDETFTIPQVGTNGVSQFDPIILAANAFGANAHLVGSFVGDVNVLGRDDALNDGIEGIALEDASSG